MGVSPGAAGVRARRAWVAPRVGGHLLGITQIREPRLCLLGLGHRWFA